MKKVIVTGANGFIGAALCKELVSHGIEVIAIVKNGGDTSSLSKLNGLRIVNCDFKDFSRLETIIPDRDIEVLYHLAWVGTAGTLRSDPNVQIDNIRFTCDTVKFCSAIGCKRMVFAASIMEYEIQALMETDCIPSVNTLYSTAKISADYMARTLAGSLGIDFIRVVISNIYGPGETSPRLINTSLRKLLHNKHCAFSPGEQMYDFIYITDAAKSFVALGTKGYPNKTYYLGSQHPKPLKEFLLQMRDQVDPEIEIGLGEIPFSGVSLTYEEVDIHAIKKDTGFVPEVSFPEGIRRTIRWIEEVD